MDFAELKQQYGKLYLIKFENLPFHSRASFIFRPLKIGEFKHYSSFLQTRPQLELQIQQEVFKKCVVESYLPPLSSFSIELIQGVRPLTEEQVIALQAEDELTSLELRQETKELVKDLLPDGVWNSLFKAIMYLSYPVTAEQWTNALNFKRDTLNSSIEAKLKAFICSVNAYKLHELEDITFEQLIELAVHTEMMIQDIPKISLPLNLTPPKAREQEGGNQNLASQAAKIRNIMGNSGREEDYIAKKKQEHQLDARAAYLAQKQKGK